MKIIIDIPDDIYEEIIVHNREMREGAKSAYYFEGLIQNGIPLPKGHDLVTKEQMIELVEFYQLNPQHFDFVSLIDEIKNEKSIIEK
jgi:hypothetical protein